ncbi:MAG: transglutaminase-like domain-containing protein [Planctomycetota bacterium]
MLPAVRKRTETALLAIISIASVVWMRMPVESSLCLSSEMLCISLLACLAWANAQGVASKAVWAAPLVSVAFAFIARTFATPITFELSGLTALGASALAMAIRANDDRMRGLSLVLSGFLCLFAASISDSVYAGVLPIVWLLGCLWHMTANRWERLDQAMPESVVRDWSIRPRTLVLAMLVLALGAWAARDRFGETRRFQFGFMPTSGGSSWSDPAARQGIGSGDAAIAAKDHAESFGAVDSDIFLESTEPSLFDMANDVIGEPKIKFKWERRQAINSENVLESHDDVAKSERGGSSFSTDRMPPKEHRHFESVLNNSIVQWDGPTGIRLAMRRYDAFDGTDWNQTEDYSNENMMRVALGDRIWFFDPGLRRLQKEEADRLSVGLLKALRLDSTRIPAPMMTSGLHIKEVDRQDFYGIDRDGSYFMPGRKKVPALTVVHMASMNPMEQTLRERLWFSADGAAFDSQTTLSDATQPAITRLATRFRQQHNQPFEQLMACVEHLRESFEFDRAHAPEDRTSLDGFLRDRRGGDHLFATTAALVARELGMKSRLVAGFYVRPGSFDVAAGHANVLPSDVHFWTEIAMRDGRWFEIEPTPGYRRPNYQKTWFQLATAWAITAWPIVLSICVLGTALIVLRHVWIEAFLTIVWKLTGWVRPSTRLRLGMGIIETRAWLAGQSRPAGLSQRSWLEDVAKHDVRLTHAASRFLDSADRLFFGMSDFELSPTATEVVSLLRTKTFHQIKREVTP